MEVVLSFNLFERLWKDQRIQKSAHYNKNSIKPIPRYGQFLRLDFLIILIGLVILMKIFCYGGLFGKYRYNWIGFMKIFIFWHAVPNTANASTPLTCLRVNISFYMPIFKNLTFTSSKSFAFTLEVKDFSKIGWYFY